MANLSADAAATYVMQHSVMRVLLAKTDIIEVYRIVSRTDHSLAGTCVYMYKYVGCQLPFGLASALAWGTCLFYSYNRVYPVVSAPSLALTNV